MGVGSGVPSRALVSHPAGDSTAGPQPHPFVRVQPVLGEQLVGWAGPRFAYGMPSSLQVVITQVTQVQPGSQPAQLGPPPPRGVASRLGGRG